MVRGFIAVDIDDDAVLNRVLETQRTVVDCGADLKAVERENIHLTLRFLGEVGESQIPEVIDALKEIQFRPIELALKGVGVFPNTRFIRVIWIGIVKGGRELSGVASTLNARLMMLRFPPDNKGFSPHLTIARVRSRRSMENVVACLRELQDRDFGQFTVDSVRLKKSTLTPSGPIYDTLFEQKAQA